MTARIARKHLNNLIRHEPLPPKGASIAVAASNARRSTRRAYGGRTEPSIEPPAIIVELASGKQVSIFTSASPALATAALKALR